jgi:hypothetical protein
MPPWTCKAGIKLGVDAMIKALKALKVEAGGAAYRLHNAVRSGVAVSQDKSMWCLFFRHEILWPDGDEKIDVDPPLTATSPLASALPEPLWTRRSMEFVDD